jgi:hypothetical protein
MGRTDSAADDLMGQPIQTAKVIIQEIAHHQGKRLTSFEQNKDYVVAEFEDGYSEGVEDTLLYFTCGITRGIVTFPIIVIALPFGALSCANTELVL